MVLGIVSFATGPFIGPFALIFSILALVFGFQGKREIRQSAGTQDGEGMATAGIVMGWVGVGIFLAALLLVVVFGLALLGFYTP